MRLFRNILEAVGFLVAMALAMHAADAILFAYVPVGADETDAATIRSGLGLRTDFGTGCQYVESRFGGVTPRLDPQGRQIVTLSLATSESWRDRTTGEKREKTEWHRVVVFTEGLATVAEQYLKKGAKVYLEGKMQTRSWEDRQGAKRYATEVVLNGFGATLVLLDRQPSTRPPAGGADDYEGPRSSSYGGEDPPIDDDVSF